MYNSSVWTSELQSSEASFHIPQPYKCSPHVLSQVLICKWMCAESQQNSSLAWKLMYGEINVWSTLLITYKQERIFIGGAIYMEIITHLRINMIDIILHTCKPAIRLTVAIKKSNNTADLSLCTVFVFICLYRSTVGYSCCLVHRLKGEKVAVSVQTSTKWINGQKMYRMCNRLSFTTGYLGSFFCVCFDCFRTI